MTILETILLAIREGVAEMCGRPNTEPMTQEEVNEFLRARQRDYGPDATDWGTSVVDLMKVLNINPAIETRRVLAEELGYPGDTSRENIAMNNWLHTELMRYVAHNFFARADESEIAEEIDEPDDDEPKHAPRRAVRAKRRR